MLLQKILLLSIVAAAVLAGYAAHKFWDKNINPRQSFKHFIIYMLANLTSVFVIVFVTGFLIIHFKEFFFSK